jgi:hypothetical protein
MTLEISHLVTNGCSYTYCQGLYDPPVQGWPRLLADKLGVPIVNLGDPGSSNDGIVRRTYNYFYKNFNRNCKPLYIIAMSQAMRREEYYAEYPHNATNSEKINDYMYLAAYDENDPLSKALYSQMDETGMCFSQERKYRLWASLINLFKAHNNPYFIGDYMPDNDSKIHQFMTSRFSELYNYVNHDPFQLGQLSRFSDGNIYPKAKDGSHDGPEAQVALADFVYNKIIEKYTDIKVKTDADFLTLKDFPTSFLRRFRSDNKWFRYQMNLHYAKDYDL